ncbi:MAG TPA: flagellar hook-basal body complex protein [Terriglobia bacterium]|nr:flagellar hook-basal body complex protein [Terriglobia bacterium]
MSTFSTSLSGLDAEEQALSVISNDLSNLNTTAFKTGTPVFSDLFYQMLGTDGAGDPVQLGVGARMSSVDSPFTQGSITTTGVSTDVAIQGSGLFVLDQGSTQVYTRAGNFTLNAEGNLVDSNGNNVMGYSAVNGSINTGGSLAPIIVSSGQTYAPNATSNVQLDMNLDATDTTLGPATGTLTVPPPTLPTAGQTATIGGTVYTFATTITPQSAANTVLIGADVQSTLANLAGAIDASSTNGQAAGTTYSTGTAANALVTATGSTATALNLQAMNTGTIGNSDATSTAWAAGSFGAADLTGGVNVKQATGTLTVPPPLPAAGQTATIGGTTYTFAAAITAQSAADTVLIDPTGSVANTLANLAGAINAASTNGQAAGTTYATGTVANATVTATGSTATALTLQALNTGAAGNQDATTSQWTAGAFGGGDLAGGVNAIPSAATFTVPPGTLPSAGDTVDIGGTTYTFVGSTAALTAADDVLIGGSVQSALTNLAGAINLSTSNGQGVGATYGTGTTINGSVVASNPTATQLTLQAAQGGTGGDSQGATTSWTGGLFAVADLTGGGTGVAASATLTAPAAVPTAGDTITVGGTTYTFANAIAGNTPPDTVLIDQTGSVATTLANLAAAITGGAGAGTTYSSVSGANPVTVSNLTATSFTLTAPQNGAGGNSTPVSTTWNGALFAGGDLAGGMDAVPATGTLSIFLPTPTAGQTVTVGGTTYTFATNLAGNSPADTVTIDPTSVQNTLANLAAAINLGAGAGTAYSSATIAANASVMASNPTASALTLTAIPVGAAGNNTIGTSTNWTGGAFGAADLTGGVDAVKATGAYTVPISLPSSGQTVTVGGTTYTFVGPTAAALTAPGDVLIGPDVATTLANLASAINATPAGAGVTYATGTTANASVTVTGSTASALTLQAIQNGSVGNAVNTSATWTGGSFGAGDLTGGTDAGTFSTTVPIYDSLGDSHVLTFNFTKAASGEWNYQITIPAADVGATGNPQVVGTGTLQFGPEGNLISPPADVQGISISGLADGAKTMSLNWQLFSSPGTAVVTQTAEASATSGTIQNGYSAGTLQSYSINSSGVINGVLSNGQTVALGQIALATFANYDGLTNLGSNDFESSLASGAPSVAAPGTGGSGTLDGISLEASNVDIATAFTQLIEAERGYEANAKAITTANDVMQASINLIQQ